MASTELASPLKHSPAHVGGAPSGTCAPQLLARARYNNVAEAGDELSFRQGDIITVVKKDFNSQVDWWLCELRGKVGMVPANYLEVFHDHDPSVYDIPRPNSKGPRPTLSPQNTPLFSVTSSQLNSTEETDSPLYDLPPGMEPDPPEDRDYDLPPPEGHALLDMDRPPSSTRLSPQGSTRSSLKSMNRISTASSAASSSGIYDIPPDPLDVYDFPKPSQPTRGFEEDGGGNTQSNTLQAVDIAGMLDDEAEDLLTSYRQVMSATYEVLFNTVYGPNAYWGTDNKVKRSETLRTTFSAAKHFDKALLILLQFGKGVVNKLEYISDTNFKKKYMNAFRALLHNRNDILGKLEALGSELDSVTGTVKSLLEIARTVPHAVTEFTILVQANKTILFRPSNKSNSSLPVITKKEAKCRPLPELPQVVAHSNANNIQEGDYAIPAESNEENQKNGRIMVVHGGDMGHDIGGTLRHRKPNDILPPLPFATLPRNAKLSGQSSISDSGIMTTSPYHSGGGGGGGDNLSVSGNRSQVVVGEDYDEIDKTTRDRSVVITSRPSIASLGSSSSRGASPTPFRIRRQGSLSSCSSSDELHNLSNLRRANSVELLDSPYGRPSYQQQSSSPQPLRMEERQILERFSKQFDLINPGLRDAIDVLLDCLRENESPKEFVTKSKLTVVSAYKLVYIADALSQKITHADTKNSIMSSSKNLTESIKSLVVATKTAALQYPSVIALEKMGEKLKQLFPTALDLINTVKLKAA